MRSKPKKLKRTLTLLGDEYINACTCCGKLYACSGGKFIEVDTSTGDSRLLIDTYSWDYAVYCDGDSKQVAVAYPKSVHIFKDGKLRLSIPLPFETLRSRPFLHKNRMWVCGINGDAEECLIFELSEGSATVVSRIKMRSSSGWALFGETEGGRKVVLVDYTYQLEVYDFVTGAKLPGTVSEYSDVSAHKDTVLTANFVDRPHATDVSAWKISDSGEIRQIFKERIAEHVEVSSDLIEVNSSAFFEVGGSKRYSNVYVTTFPVEEVSKCGDSMCGYNSYSMSHIKVAGDVEEVEAEELYSYKISWDDSVYLPAHIRLFGDYVIVSGEQTVCVYELETGKTVNCFEPSGLIRARLSAVAGDILYVFSQEGSCILSNDLTGIECFGWAFPLRGGWFVAHTEQGTHFPYGGIAVFDNKGRLRWSALRNSDKTVGDCGGFVCLSSGKDLVTGYEKQSGNAVFTIRSPDAFVLLPCSGSRFAIAGSSNAVVYDVSDRRPRELFRAYGIDHAVSVSEDCSYIAVSARTGVMLYSEKWSKWVKTSLASSASYDGRLLATLDSIRKKITVYAFGLR